MARPEYIPSPTDRATVQNLAVLGANHETIAKCLGDYGISAKTLRKHFKRELEVSSWQVKAGAMSQLVKAINDGAPWAVRFFLATKCGFTETQAHRLVDEEGKDRGLTLADIDAAIAEAESEFQPKTA